MMILAKQKGARVSSCASVIGPERFVRVVSIRSSQQTLGATRAAGVTPSVSREGFSRVDSVTGSFCLRVSSGFAKSQTCTFGVLYMVSIRSSTYSTIVWISSLLPVKLWFDSKVEGKESQEEEHPRFKKTSEVGQTSEVSFGWLSLCHFAWGAFGFGRCLFGGG